MSPSRARKHELEMDAEANFRYYAEDGEKCFRCGVEIANPEHSVLGCSRKHIPERAPEDEIRCECGEVIGPGGHVCILEIEEDDPRRVFGVGNADFL